MRFHPGYQPTGVPARFLLSVFASGLLLASCSQAVPRVVSTSLKLVYEESAAGPVERLSFFALAEDEDGFLDLEELDLIQDEAELYWSLSEKDWLQVERSGLTWIGSHSLSMYGDSAFPRGSYRVVISDKAGERSERVITLNAPVQAARAFPALSVSGTDYRVTSAYPENSLVAYSASGSLLETKRITKLEGSLKELSLERETVSIALWAEDPATQVAAFTKPVNIK